MATLAHRRVHTILRLPSRGGRRRLAARVRRRANEELEHFHRAGVVEFSSMAIRASLFELVARRLEDKRRPLSREGLAELERLLTEPSPARDYGPRAAARNERLADILDALDDDQKTA